MRSPKFLISITALRKKYPKSYLGWRERDILFKKGSKITKASGYKDGYRVRSYNNSFVFTYGKKGYKDFTIIN